MKNDRNAWQLNKLIAMALLAASPFLQQARAALGPDTDGDGLPDTLEVLYGRDVNVKDNDIFGSSGLFTLQQYRDFFGREGDAAGVQGWTNALLAGTYTRQQVIDAFLSSQEFSGNVAPVARLYFATFLRVPDYAGLIFNAGLVHDGTISIAQLADFFTTSPEFAATYGSLDNTQFVTLLYNNVLGRAPDQAGLNGWVQLLVSGGYSRGQVLLGFSESTEYQAAMANKVFVTMMYVGMLRRTPEPTGFNAWVALMVSGTPRASVIDGFFQSTEYRNRFLGPDANAKIRSYDAAAARLLNSTSFGATAAMVASIREGGPNQWVESQLYTPSTVFPPFPYYPATQPANCVFTTNSTTPQSICERDNYTLYQVQNVFFRNALAAPDQLRQRVAFALSQIFVVSGFEIAQAYAMAGYQQKLIDGAFGNFEDLMYAVTLDPVMGRYLDMANNQKANTSGSVQPNENYARELMQLFTLGVWMLNPDGSFMLDAQSNPIPTYDQNTILNFARIYTGWTYPTAPGALPPTGSNTNPTSYNGPMIPVVGRHDTGSKVLLPTPTAPTGQVIPANQTPDMDVRDALHNIFTHPNVGPFVGRQLIQHLVTANPSPAYVARVSAVFNNNGSGVRGDLRSVVRAVVLDPEALTPTAPEHGKLREPVVFVTAFLRAMGGGSDGLYMRQQASNMSQNAYNSPSVFNYYPADYIIPGTDLDGPTFGIWNATTIFARANYIYQMTFGNGAAPDTTLAGAVGTHINMANFQPYAGNPDQLVDLLGSMLLPGQMTPELKTPIVAAVTAVTATNTLDRVRTAIYLIAASPRFQLER